MGKSEPSLMSKNKCACSDYRQMDGSAKSYVNTLPCLIYERDSWENISIGNRPVLTDEKCQRALLSSWAA